MLPARSHVRRPDVALVAERWVWRGYGDRREHDHEYVQREWYAELLNY